MRHAALLSLALAPSVALAQNSTILAGLVGALSAAGLTQLINVATTINSTSVGQSILANITSGSPFLLFAPNNDAWSKAPANFTSPATTLADVFSYHVVPGNFSAVQTQYPNITLGQTLYDDPLTVHLEGGKPQVVAWSERADGKTHVLNQRNDSTVVNTTTFGNLTIFIIDNVLQVPENLEDTIPTNNLSLNGFSTLLKSATLSFYNASTASTSDVTFFDAFNTGYHGFTLFSPNDTAITAANGTLAGIAGNRTALNSVLFNHVINATSLYTPLLAGSQNFTTAGGEALSFKLNATGQYVTLGNITAMIVQPDVLLPNGVVHIIDRVLLDTDSDPSSASSALSSATSAASASQSSQTAPIGFSITSSLASAASSAAAAASSSGSSSGAASFGFSAHNLVGLTVALAAAVFGGVMTIF
ncbi:fasciclin domain-containing protein [Phanerochaete sordida]|uniref:Fasciclin domain-containing protein n=1 Tax=Phanerochaete sordida TaxID=48140 RepID=A0A9P3LJL7_9APHY|nr:fasciclin domain-containing protein [Phanerochaete sordida]